MMKYYKIRSHFFFKNKNSFYLLQKLFSDHYSSFTFSWGNNIVITPYLSSINCDIMRIHKIISYIAKISDFFFIIL